jgi:hypothetical protein
VVAVAALLVEVYVEVVRPPLYRRRAAYHHAQAGRWHEGNNRNYYHTKMWQKWKEAASHPWSVVEPDPPPP